MECGLGRELLFREILRGIILEGLHIRAGTEVIGFILMGVGEFLVLVYPKLADRILYLALFLGKYKTGSHGQGHYGDQKEKSCCSFHAKFTKKSLMK
jgi:hypothetical protein